MTQPVGRIRSLDIFRGLTVAAMILVNNPGSWSAIYPPLEHAEWNGWTPTDLIFPFFVFIMGLTAALVIANRLAAGTAKSVVARQVVVRAALLFLVGLLLNGFPKYDLAGTPGKSYAEIAGEPEHDPITADADAEPAVPSH